MASIGVNIPDLVAKAAENILESHPDTYKSTVPGPQGIQGVPGRNIHHIVHDRSILPDGNTMPGIGRGDWLDEEIEPGIPGNKDVYVGYADEEEYSYVGEITVHNGNSAYLYAVKGGFTGTEEEFTTAVSNINTVINDGNNAVASAEAARDKAKLWANEAEDVEVETGEYSSLHWAAKAKTDTLHALAVADTKVNISDIIDNVTSTDVNKPLSANQGKILNDAITLINNLLTSDDTTLDELQEVVNFIKANRDSLNNLTLDNIAETSTNKWFTLAYRDKLDGVEAGATADQTKEDIDSLGIDAATVNGKTVLTSVPEGAVFTDTVYTHPISHPATMITTTDEFTYSNATNVQDVLDDLDQAITDINAKDPVITLTGGVTGTGTMTNLGSVSITTTITDDSHNHIVSNVDGLQDALDSKAPLNSPTLTGEPTAPTPVTGDNSAKIATTAFAHTEAANAVNSHANKTDNPHSVTKTQVGLGNVDNTSDVDKPISTAQQAALNLKQNTLAEGAFIDGDKTKLDSIEAGATGDQTGAEIKALYEAELNTNAYTDAEKTKLANTETTSQLNLRDINNRNADNHTDGATNGVYTLEERAKLSGIEIGATADQTGPEIKAAYDGEYVTRVGSNYIDSATNLDEVVDILDTQIKATENSIGVLTGSTEW